VAAATATISGRPKVARQSWSVPVLIARPTRLERKNGTRVAQLEPRAWKVHRRFRMKLLITPTLYEIALATAGWPPNPSQRVSTKYSARSTKVLSTPTEPNLTACLSHNGRREDSA